MMKIYIDGSQLVRKLTIKDFRREREDAVLSIAEKLHKRAKCFRFSWMDALGYESLAKLMKSVFDLLKEHSSSLSEPDQKAMKSFLMSISWVDAPLGSSAFHEASCNASLVWVLLRGDDEIVESYDFGGVSRQVVKISKYAHLKDDAVCRVLYCNHPEVNDNSSNKGYVSLSRGDKHFLDTNNAESWVEDTDEITKGYGKKVSKFRPGITWESEDYKKLERSALLDAMRKGKYSLERMKGHVYTHGEDVGASDGERTHKVCVDTSNRDVHLYPVPNTTPNN